MIPGNLEIPNPAKSGREGAREVMEHLRAILNLTRGHNHYMQDRVDLIASNSWTSQFTRLTMCSLLTNNYCIGLPGNRLYGGCAYIDMLEREVERLAANARRMEPEASER